MRVMLNVEPHSRSLLQMICTRLMTLRARGDKLFLAQVSKSENLTRAQSGNNRRVFDNFQTLALGELERLGHGRQSAGLG